MSYNTDEKLDAYVRGIFLAEDDALTAAQQRAVAAGLPTIQVPPVVGRLLDILVRCVGAHRVLEIGTLGGYSAIWMARALPADGRLVSLEVSEKHAAVARENFQMAGVAERVEVRVGPAADTLPMLANELPFDFAFIDADKGNYPTYLDWSARLVRPGGLIVAHNVLRGGRVLDLANASEEVRATDHFNRVAAADPRLASIILPDYDGVFLATVLPRG